MLQLSSRNSTDFVEQDNIRNTKRDLVVCSSWNTQLEEWNGQGSKQDHTEDIITPRFAYSN